MMVDGILAFFIVFIESKYMKKMSLALCLFPLSIINASQLTVPKAQEIVAAQKDVFNVKAAWDQAQQGLASSVETKNKPLILMVPTGTKTIDLRGFESGTFRKTVFKKDEVVLDGAPEDLKAVTKICLPKQYPFWTSGGDYEIAKSWMFFRDLFSSTPISGLEDVKYTINSTIEVGASQEEEDFVSTQEDNYLQVQQTFEDQFGTLDRSILASAVYGIRATDAKGNDGFQSPFDKKSPLTVYFWAKTCNACLFSDECTIEVERDCRLGAGISRTKKQNTPSMDICSMDSVLPELIPLGDDDSVKNIYYDPSSFIVYEKLQKRWSAIYLMQRPQQTTYSEPKATQEPDAPSLASSLSTSRHKQEENLLNNDNKNPHDEIKSSSFQPQKGWFAYLFAWLWTKSEAGHASTGSMFFGLNWLTSLFSLLGWRS